MRPILDRISAARMALLFDFPFFGRLAMLLETVVTEKVLTAATDGKQLLVNEQFIGSLSDAKLRGLIAHEVLHCALFHQTRLGGRESRKANVAMDMVINPICIEAGLELPDGGEMPKPGWEGFSWEKIYTLLPENQMACSWGGVLPCDSGSAPTWEVALRSATLHGGAPAGIERLVKEREASRIDWRQYIWQWIGAFDDGEDYSWRSPSRRTTEFFVPRLKSQSVLPLAVAIDTSGSIDERRLRAFLSEVHAITEDVRPQALFACACDTAVNATAEALKGEELVIRPIGGGWTDFRPVFEWLHQLEERPACLLFFTDLEGCFPDASEIPTLWLSVNDDVFLKAPFGETVHFKI